MAPHKHAKINIKPGTVCILLKGRHAGKRVVFLRELPSGQLLITGPRKINQVSLTKVSRTFVIATATSIDLGDFKLADAIDEKFLGLRKKPKAKDILGIEQQDKPKECKPKGWKKLKNSINKAVSKRVDAVPDMRSYLSTLFTLRKGEYPHEMKF